MVRLYLRAVFHHWAAAMTGTAGLLASVVAAARNSNTLFVVLTAVLGVSFLFLAGYKAWKEERENYEGELAKNQRPEIHGEAFEFVMGIHGHGNAPKHCHGGIRFSINLCNYRAVNTNLVGIEIDRSGMNPPVRFSRPSSFHMRDFDESA
jgi:hypothetical protein